MPLFPQLEDYLLPAPLSACIAILMCFGIKLLGKRLVGILRNSSPDTLESSAGFILAAGVVAIIAHIMAFLGFAYLWPLRIMAWGLSLFGIIEIYRLKQVFLPAFLQNVQKLFLEQSLWGKAGVILVGITGAGLCLAALGPPTDADSLDYHLGIPLDILRHHQDYPRLDWLDARLVGLGEYLNMFGLAGGTDILGATMQLSGLVVVLFSITSLAKSDSDRILAAMIVIGCPLLLFLIPNQKPQMLPVAGTTIALILIVNRFKSMDMVTIVLAFGSTFFSMSCKYSFVLSGTIVLLTGLIAAYQSKRFWTAIMVALACLLIFLVPLYLQKYLYYGDPLTPLLERFFAHGQPAVIHLAERLKNCTDSSFPFPLSLILPDSFGTITTILGVGSLLVVAAPGIQGASRVFMACALLSGSLTYFLGQVTSRFYLEPYLWITIAFTVGSGWKFKPVIFRIMLVQLAGMALMASFGAARLFPGAISDPLRHQVMLKSSYQYAEAKWLNTILPENSVILTDLRSKALIPRPFISSEIVNYYLSGKVADNSLQLVSFLKQKGVNTWVTTLQAPNAFIETLFPVPVGDAKVFQQATRNPWNISTGQLRVYKSQKE